MSKQKQDPPLEVLWAELRSAVLNPARHKELASLARKICRAENASSWFRDKGAHGGRPDKKRLVFDAIQAVEQRLGKDTFRGKDMTLEARADLVHKQIEDLIAGWKQSISMADEEIRKIQAELAIEERRRITLTSREELTQAEERRTLLKRQLDASLGAKSNSEKRIREHSKIRGCGLDRKTVTKYVRLWILESEDWLDHDLRTWRTLAKDDPDYVHRAYFQFKAIFDMTAKGNSPGVEKAYRLIVTALQGLPRPFEAPSYSAKITLP